MLLLEGYGDIAKEALAALTRLLALPKFATTAARAGNRAIQKKALSKGNKQVDRVGGSQ